MLGRVANRAYRMTRMTKKIGYEKLKDKTWSCSLSRPLSNKNTPLNYQMQNFESEMQVKDFKRTNTNVTILNPNKSMHGKTLVKMVHKSGHEKWSAVN